jgi:[acyl-carrier-protein] S-malonyltransferase
MNDDLKARIADVAFAFRGYNVTNLGRSAELLAHPRYGPTVERILKEASEICSDVTGKRANLVRRVSSRREATLRNYPEAVAMIVALEMAHIQLLEEFHGVSFKRARMSLGYSLGELTAVACGGTFALEDVLLVPLSMAQDCAELARDVTMGVLFSRGPAINEELVLRLCMQIDAENQGVIGVSSILSPNTYLLLGQGETVQRFKLLMEETFPKVVSLRINPHRWPPLHSPIMWQRNIPNRSARMMQSLKGGDKAPTPPVLSMVTGKMSYNDYNARYILHQWVDHPQRLWDAVCGVLAANVQIVVHVGPEPNLIPATFKRLADNIQQQVSKRTIGSLGLRAVSRMIRRQWLAGMLPSRSSLLRAPGLRHVILEDWLLDHAKAAGGV